MMKKNQSDGLTEADCSRQMGRYKRMIFRRIILCLHIHIHIHIHIHMFMFLLFFYQKLVAHGLDSGVRVFLKSFTVYVSNGLSLRINFAES